MTWGVNEIGWLVALVAFIVVEAVTAGLVSIWFAFGALAALVVAMLGGAFVWQLTAFMVFSAIMLYFTQPLAKKLMKEGKVKTNVDALLGKIAIVEKPIFKNEFGQVKIDGNHWTAKSNQEEVIPENAEVEVIAVEGVKLIVRAINKQ